MKRCSKCGEFKALTEFNKQRANKDGHRYQCRKCDYDANKIRHRAYGQLPMYENKACTTYLGIAVAEKLVGHLFKDVVRMPYGNPGFDFICAKDQKIDVKSACVSHVRVKYSRWLFCIDKNTTADYFLLLAFNNRVDLEPLYQWLIPGHILNHLITTTISPSTIDKWDAYMQPIGPTIACCNTLKENEYDSIKGDE